MLHARTKDASLCDTGAELLLLLPTCTATTFMVQLWPAVTPSGLPSKYTHMFGGRASFMLAVSKR